MKAELLREILIDFYELFLSDPENKNSRSRAREIYTEWMGLASFVEEEIKNALNLLVDIGWEAGKSSKQVRSESAVALNQLLNKERPLR